MGYSEHWHLGTPVDLFRRIRDEVNRLQPRYRVKVYVSAEIDVLNSRGDLACDLDAAVSTLDDVSVAISHYGTLGVEQLLGDRVEDTVRMIEAVCAIPAVTMLMHPQIVYGRSLEHIAQAVPPGVYEHAIGLIAASGKVVDYPSVRMNADWLRTLYGAGKLAIERDSSGEFTRAVVARGVRLSPGSDAHNVWWHGSTTRWLGNNVDSLALLEANGYRDEQLWYGPAGGGHCR